jgi:hypothetical protein
VAVIAGRCNGPGGGNMRRPAVMFALTLAVGGVRFASWKDEKPGGQSTPRCGGTEAGRQEADREEKNTGMEAGVFFYFAAPNHGEGAVPPPLSRGRTGLRPEGMKRSGMTGESKPLLCLLRGGSPAAGGRDNDCRLRTAA